MFNLLYLHQAWVSTDFGMNWVKLKDNVDAAKWYVDSRFLTFFHKDMGINSTVLVVSLRSTEQHPQH